MKQLSKPVRYLIFVLGLVTNSFGIALITKAGLGTSPISSVPYVLSLGIPVFSFGLWTFIVNSLFILIQVLLLKKEFQPIQFLQILVNVVFSSLIDLAMFILQFFHPDTFLAELCTLVIGCAVLGFGVALEVAPGVIMVPGEGIVQVISQVSNQSFSLIKNLFDLTLMITSALLSLFFFRGFKGIGIGTLIAAVLVGRFVSLSNTKLPFILKIKELSSDGTPADNPAKAKPSACVPPETV